VTAAIDALNRVGYPAASTVLVADLARVSRGAMLHQFPNKAALMAAVVEASYAADIAAYRRAVAGIKDPVAQMLAVAEAAWVQFRAAGGIAQTEIRMATRSDPELAAAVLPIFAAISENSKVAQAARFAAAGIADRAVSDAVLTHNVAMLRGLALEFVLGTPEAALRPSIELMKRSLLMALSPGGKAST
jgi:AcrR family transcriptional regulator